MQTLPPLFPIPMLSREFEAMFVDRATYLRETAKLFSQVFPGNPVFRPNEIDEARAEKAQALREKFSSMSVTVKILVREKSSGEIVGWMSGEQHDWESFYLRNSGFIPRVRRKGLYRAMHAGIIDYLRETGFERVVSDHLPNNKAILILKLHFGYYINSVTLDDRFGPLTRLVYFLNEDRRKGFESRFQI